MKYPIICTNCEEEYSLEEGINKRAFSNLKEQAEIEAEKKIERKELQLKKEIADNYELELKDLKNQIQEKAHKINKNKEAELSLRKNLRLVEERERELELELRRKLDEEKSKLRDEITEKVTADYLNRDKEREKHISDMRSQIIALKRRSEISSQELQGESFELDLEELLKKEFPDDVIEAVPKGINGADLNQIIKNSGSIVIEAKNTKTFSKKWLDKIKDDMSLVKDAALGIIVTESFPKECNGKKFFQLAGIWITNRNNLVGLIMALRNGLIAVGKTKLMAKNSTDKMGLLYEYLCGSSFKNKITAVVETFMNMKEDLDREKRAFQRIWKAREQGINRISSNVCEIVGDIEGIAGNNFLPINKLSLPE